MKNILKVLSLATILFSTNTFAAGYHALENAGGHRVMVAVVGVPQQAGMGAGPAVDPVEAERIKQGAEYERQAGEVIAQFNYYTGRMHALQFIVPGADLRNEWCMETLAEMYLTGPDYAHSPTISVSKGYCCLAEGGETACCKTATPCCGWKYQQYQLWRPALRAQELYAQLAAQSSGGKKVAYEEKMGGAAAKDRCDVFCMATFCLIPTAIAAGFNWVFSPH